MSKEIGNKGEELAEKFLRSNGYDILTKNYHTRIGEIDIVARDGAELVFTEVKTRTSQTFGLPQESVTKSKIRKLRQTALLYIAENNIKSSPFRIDVISIQLEKTGKVKSVDHIKNILDA
ncbi:MAG: YraN family protein [Patescibacteria group bacterium]|nr:YraN family protein [Patescibacteria group bacterium]